jgi:hypothetical protein
MKYLSFLIISLCLCCGGKVQMVKSTSQEWVGGLQESGYGTDYTLTIKAKAGSDRLQFDELWVGDKHMKVRVIADPANLQNKTFKKGSRITVKAGFTSRPGPDEKSRLIDADNTAWPAGFKGAGLLGYTCQGKKYYLEIAGFETLERIIYP